MKKLFVVIAGVVFGVLLAGVAEAGRNSGGTFTYTLSGAGPVVKTGDTISSAWANNSLTEIQTALTDSLSRSGLGGMSAGLKLVDGAGPGSPGAYFSSSATTGIYYTAGPTINLSANSTNVLACTSTGCSVPGTFNATADVTFSSAASISKNLTLGGNLKLTTAGTTVHYTTVKPGAVTTDYDLTLPVSPPAGTAWGSGSYNAGDRVIADSGKVYVCDTPGTSTVAPSGTSADQSPGGTSRWDYYAADYTQPVVLSPAGALSTAPITNNLQNFGTPVEDRDVAIKSYVDSGLGGIGGVGTMVCTQADSATTNSTTFVDVDLGPSVALPAAGVYEVWLEGSAIGTSGGVVSYYWQLAYTGTIAPNATLRNTAVSTALGTVTATQVTAPQQLYSTISSTVAADMMLMGVLRVSTTGTLKLQHRVSNTSINVRAQAGTCLRIRRVF